VPGWLRCGGKIGGFSPHLRDMAAGLGGFSGIARWRERVLAGTGANCEKNATGYPARGVGGCPRRRNRKKPVYRPIRPASRHQNPALGGKPHRITAKTAVLANLAISAKCGHRRGVPGGLRHGGKPGGFSPHLRDMAAVSGDFIGIERRSGRVLAGNGA
jgi:hypothetical protein